MAEVVAVFEARWGGTGAMKYQADRVSVGVFCVSDLYLLETHISQSYSLKKFGRRADFGMPLKPFFSKKKYPKRSAFYQVTVFLVCPLESVAVPFLI